MKKLITSVILILISVNITYSQISEDWIQRFTSDSIRNESVNDMFIDAAGNVYVTGSQRALPFPNQAQIQAVTVKYNSQGIQQWIQNYQAQDNNGALSRAIHVDNAGNVYVTGEDGIYSGGSNKALIIKYGPDGTQLWSYRFSYNTFYNAGFDIVTDADGNVYVAGEYYTGATFYNNIFLIKFDPSGSLVNQTFYNSASEGARKIGLDGSGKIIVGGYINHNDTLSFIALKYEQNLDFDWASVWGQGVGNQNPIDMAIDNNSNIILSGTNSVSVDYQTVKFDPAGSFVWGKLYNSSAGWDICRSVAKDNSGNIYVTGETGTTGFPTSYKMTTIKYDPAGNEVWVNAYDGGNPGITGYYGYDVSLDDSSNVLVTGNTSGLNFITVKYNNAGDLKWDITYNGIGGSGNSAVAVGADHSGNVYTTGTSLGDTTGYDIAIIKYKPTTIGIENISYEVPEGYSLSQNYPNPFNPSTKLGFGISDLGFVSLKIYDVQGREVAVLVNENLSPGSYEFEWNASGFTSGVYFYKLQAGQFTETKKMLLTK
ncbi:MAG: SBBP repeat-containing protein [Ignavibacteriae bacterium]|nr:SBBP repeat-containing protein [Ignavibacteriota bacterium]